MTERSPHKRRWRKLAPGAGLCISRTGDELPDGAPWSPWSVRHAVNSPLPVRFVVRRGFRNRNRALPTQTVRHASSPSITGHWRGTVRGNHLYNLPFPKSSPLAADKFVHLGVIKPTTRGEGTAAYRSISRSETLDELLADVLAPYWENPSLSPHHPGFDKPEAQLFRRRGYRKLRKETSRTTESRKPDSGKEPIGAVIPTKIAISQRRERSAAAGVDTPAIRRKYPCPITPLIACVAVSPPLHLTPS